MIWLYILLGVILYAIPTIFVGLVFYTFDDPYNHQGRTAKQRAWWSFAKGLLWWIWIPWGLYWFIRFWFGW